MTSVDFLLRQFALLGYDVHKYETIINEAKEMEKKQYLKMSPYDLDELANECSIDWNGEVMDGACGIYKEGFQKALELLTIKSEQYYNETLNKTNNKPLNF